MFSLFLIGLLTSLGSPDNDSDVHANSQAHGKKYQSCNFPGTWETIPKWMCKIFFIFSELDGEFLHKQGHEQSCCYI